MSPKKKKAPVGVPGAHKAKGVQRLRLRPRPARIAKPIIALATPAAEHPVVSIDRLKGGELVWSLRVPAASITRAIDRAVTEAARLQKRLDAWKADQEKYKLDTLAEGLRQSGARIARPKGPAPMAHEADPAGLEPPPATDPT